MTAPPVVVTGAIDPPVPEATVAKWSAIFTAVVLLGTGIAASFSLNLNKDALLALVPAAAFLAAAIVTAVHSHGAHAVAVTRIQAGVRIAALAAQGVAVPAELSVVAPSVHETKLQEGIAWAETHLHSIEAESKKGLDELEAMLGRLEHLIAQNPKSNPNITVAVPSVTSGGYVTTVSPPYLTNATPEPIVPTGPLQVTDYSLDVLAPATGSVG